MPDCIGGHRGVAAPLAGGGWDNGCDSDGDGLRDWTEDANLDGDNDPSTNPWPNTDGDNQVNYLDDDDDGDGIATVAEGADPDGDGKPFDAADADFDGQPDYLDRPTGVSNGRVFAEQKISATDGGLVGPLDAADLFGFSASALGDLDGDGTVDLAVSALRDDDGLTDVGAVYVLFMNSDGTVRVEQKISATQGGLAGPFVAADWFGTNIGAIGDIDGDGVPDLGVGAQHDDDGGNAAGAVYILFLNKDGTVKAEQKISNSNGGLTETLDALDRFGTGVDGIGDLDGDGVPDIVVGAQTDNDGAVQAGAVYILFLNADGTVKAEQKISALVGGLASPLEANDMFGTDVGSIGDLDGDGIVDITVSVEGDDDGGTDTGALYILFLNADGTVKAEQKISATSGGLTADLDATDAFGWSFDSLGDFDGDGRATLAASAFHDDDGVTNSGAVYLLDLETDGTVSKTRKISSTVGGKASLASAEWFGASVAAIGDANADGVVDIFVGAFGNGRWRSRCRRRVHPVPGW